MTGDLVERLRSALDRADEIARAAGARSMEWREDSAFLTDMVDPLPSQRRDRPGWIPMITTDDIRHIAANNPAVVLRIIQAHGKILDRHVRGVSHPEECGRCNDPFPCEDIEALASIYFPEGTPNADVDL